MNYGYEIRRKRREKQLTIDQLINALDALGYYGWFASKLAKIERGEQEITAYELEQVMKALQVERIASFMIYDHRHPARLLQPN